MVVNRSAHLNVTAVVQAQAAHELGPRPHEPDAQVRAVTRNIAVAKAALAVVQRVPVVSVVRVLKTRM